MRTPSNLPPGVTDAMIDAHFGNDLDPDVVDDVIADPEVVGDWLVCNFGGQGCEHTAALIRIMLAGSSKAQSEAIETLREMFIADNAVIIDIRAEEKMTRERDERDDARAHRWSDEE